MIYRSMIVISGATRPEAQAAAVTSDVIRHGRFVVVHVCGLKGRTWEDFEGARGRTTFGARSRALSVIAPLRPLGSRLRVIICSAYQLRRCSPSLDKWVAGVAGQISDGRREKNRTGSRSRRQGTLDRLGREAREQVYISHSYHIYNGRSWYRWFLNAVIAV